MLTAWPLTVVSKRTSSLFFKLLKSESKRVCPAKSKRLPLTVNDFFHPPVINVADVTAAIHILENLLSSAPVDYRSAPGISSPCMVARE